MANKWLKKLQALEGAVVDNYNPWDHVIRSPSPSINFCFGNGHGLPLGFTLALGGVPKGGKTLLCNAIIGQIHKDDSDAIVAKYDTELREQGQMTDQQAALWGVDRERYMAYSVNTPALVFDAIEQKLGALCDDGMPLKLVVIDSITGIQGRRALNAESIDVQQIGDLAATLQEGFKRILPIQRKHKFALIATMHVRAEMDKTEQMRGNKIRMAMSFGVQHSCEWFGMIEPNLTKPARQDLAGNEFKDESLGDIADNAEQTGHKIRFKIKDSSMGPKGRVGEFTLDYHKGIINTHEEVFLLGANRGIIEKPNNLVYAFGDQKWNGKPAILAAIKEDPALYKAILDEVYRRDQDGVFEAQDGKAGIDE